MEVYCAIMYRFKQYCLEDLVLYKCKVSPQDLWFLRNSVGPLKTWAHLADIEKKFPLRLLSKDGFNFLANPNGISVKPSKCKDKQKITILTLLLFAKNYIRNLTFGNENHWSLKNTYLAYISALCIWWLGRISANLVLIRLYWFFDRNFQWKVWFRVTKFTLFCELLFLCKFTVC